MLRAIAHHHRPDQPGPSRGALELHEHVPASSLVVNGDRIRRTEKAFGPEPGSEQRNIQNARGVRRHRRWHASVPRRRRSPSTRRDPACASRSGSRCRSRRRTGCRTRQGIRRSSRWRSRSHRGSTRREHGVRVLPERHAVDQRVQRHFVAANVHEVVVPADHARRRAHDRIRQRDASERSASHPGAPSSAWSSSENACPGSPSDRRRLPPRWRRRQCPAPRRSSWLRAAR